MGIIAHKKHGSFRQGFHEGIPIAIGYLPIAITFGLLAKTTGLTLFETVLMSLIVYAGASQFMALSMLAIGTVGLEIIFTTFIVNIRHFLMNTVINEQAEKDDTYKKVIYAFGITDETFSVIATKEEKLSTGYIFGVVSVAYASWGISTVVGFMIGSVLPQFLQESMTIALFAMFAGLLAPSMKNSWKVVFLAALAACFNSIFVFSNILSTGWAIVAATILSAVLVEMVDTFKAKGRMVIE